MAPRTRADHGWWPYLLPYVAFLLAVELVRRLPDDWAPVGLLLKPGVPGVLLLYFLHRGAYPELRRGAAAPARRVLDVGVGIALAGLWVAPYVLFEGLRPASASFFEPGQLGPDAVHWVIGLRLLGYGLVTPVFEELFIRSFVMRYAEVFQSRGDFRNVPLAHFTTTSFLVTTIVFTLGHAPWQWWVAVPWVVLTNLWFYWRKDLYAVITVHAATNASLLAAAAVWGQAPGRNPLSLWLFA